MSFLQMSLTGGVMIAVITLLRALAMNHVPKKTFLALWGAALLRLLVPVSLPSPLSVYSLLARERAARLPEVTAAVMRLPSAIPAGQAGAQETAASFPVWSIVWIAGVLLCAAFFAVAYCKCRREFRMSLPVENDYTRRWLAEHPLQRRLAIRQSDRVSSPLTFGVLRPVILMPKAIDWTDERALAYVLEHEFVHIRRFDALWKLLLIAAACAHWFNPLVWAMYVLANRDLELSCDETVVRRFGGARASYARVLIGMEAEKSGFAPLCNHFSRTAIEERITAIMKTKKITVISLLLAAALIAGTVTVFATSEQRPTGAVTEESAAASGGAEAVESGEPLKPGDEYRTAGIANRGPHWYYDGKSVAMIYDDNGGIYTDESAENGSYLHVQRDAQGAISGVDVLEKEAFRELVDRGMNARYEVTSEEEALMSYVDPYDGKTYYSFDGGKTFEPLTDAEFEARYPTPDVEWWTYDEYKAWLEQEKVALQSLVGESGTAGGVEFTWTQEKVDETIALYESLLADIQNGVLYSKTVDGSDDVMLVMNPADIAMNADADMDEYITN